MNRYLIRRWLTYYFAISVIFLSGCASYVTTQVTAFSDWKNATPLTYAFISENKNTSSDQDLEKKTYENMVSDALSKFSFAQVAENKARYLVSLSYGIKNHVQIVSEPVYTGAWYPQMGYGFLGGPMMAMPVTYQNQIYKLYWHFLSVRITDKQTKKEVYRVQAQNLNEQSALIRAMPFLVDSAFANFPLNNGDVVRIRMRTN